MASENTYCIFEIICDILIPEHNNDKLNIGGDRNSPLWEIGNYRKYFLFFFLFSVHFYIHVSDFFLAVRSSVLYEKEKLLKEFYELDSTAFFYLFIFFDILHDRCSRYCSVPMPIPEAPCCTFN
jgi:hypothetical protein